MFSIIGVLVFSVIVVINILLICGLPLGEFTMGGQYKILPNNMRVAAIISLVGQIFAIIILLQAGGYVNKWFSFNVTRIICYVFAGYLLLNTVMNFFSKSKKEKYVITPLSFLTLICFLITAIQMK